MLASQCSRRTVGKIRGITVEHIGPLDMSIQALVAMQVALVHLRLGGPNWLHATLASLLGEDLVLCTLNALDKHSDASLLSS